MNDEGNRALTAHAAQTRPDYAADRGAPDDCACEFCSPEPEPIPAPWERTGDAGHELRPLSMAESESDETPTLTLIPLTQR